MYKSSLHPVARRLIALRCLRSIGQGALVVDLSLYLKDLHWSAASIGGVTSAAGLVGSALILAVGILSDRMGRKPFLIAYELLTFVAAVLACRTTSPAFLALAIVVAGFGRGQSGAAGPFSPAEQAWLSAVVPQPDRGRVFSLNNAAGFWGMAAGAVLGGIPDWFPAAQPLIAYRPIFILTAVTALIGLIMVATMPEQRPLPAARERAPAAAPPAAEAPARDTEVRRWENRALAKLALVNLINGLAIGLTGPLMAYWFSLRYGVTAHAISLTMATGFIAVGLSSVASGWLAQRLGMVRSVTVMRVAGSCAMLALPWMPTFSAASVLFVLRNAVNRGTQGNRSALSASLTRDSRRGLAVSINALSNRLPSALGPAITGYLLDAGWLSLPLVLTAVLQLVNAAAYQRLFGAYDRRDPAEEER